MNSALAREQLRANRIRDLASSHSRNYEDTSEEERDQLEQEREADYNKYKKASGSHTATGVSLAASFYKDIASSIKGVLPKVAKGLSTSVGGYLQGASSSLNYGKRIVEADKQRGHQKELGGLGRVNQGMNIFKSIMPTAITGNIAKTLMTGAGSPVGLSSMFNPMMFGGMMGLSFITKMMTNRKIQKLNVTRKTMIQEQKRSLARLGHSMVIRRSTSSSQNPNAPSSSQRKSGISMQEKIPRMPGTKFLLPNTGPQT